MTDQITRWAIELQALAQAGLTYGRDDFDLERYAQVRQIAAQMMAWRTGEPLDVIESTFCSESGYQTPKVDTRAAIVRGDEILLVQEKDGRWSLPGGWCDVHVSPADNTVKEAREEAGRHIRIDRVIAVQDRAHHNEPDYAFSVVKIFYAATELGGEFTPNIETRDCRYFRGDELPTLAEDKVNAEQVLMCLEAAGDPHWVTRFD